MKHAEVSSPAREYWYQNVGNRSGPAVILVERCFSWLRDHLNFTISASAAHRNLPSHKPGGSGWTEHMSLVPLIQLGPHVEIVITRSMTPGYPATSFTRKICYYNLMEKYLNA